MAINYNMVQIHRHLVDNRHGYLQYIHIFKRHKMCIIIIISISSSSSIQPLGLFGRNQSPVRQPVWLWHAAFLGKFLGVVCHCFSLPLDVPTFATRCLHVPINTSTPSSERWNCGREWSGNFAEMTPFKAI
jgi:hypothetical protein